MGSPAGASLGFRHRFEPGASPWTILLLHGTGGDESSLLALGRELAPQAALLSPRGQVLEDGRHPRFFRRHGVGRLDLEDLKDRADELAGFVRDAAAAYERDPGRVVALGYSNGANIAVELLFRHPGLLRGAALLRTMLPYEPEPGLALSGTDVLVAAGRSDPYSPVPTTERLVEVLGQAGAAVRLELGPAGHELTPADVMATRGWLEELTGTG